MNPVLKLTQYNLLFSFSQWLPLDILSSNPSMCTASYYPHLTVLPDKFHHSHILDSFLPKIEFSSPASIQLIFSGFSDA